MKKLSLDHPPDFTAAVAAVAAGLARPAPRLAAKKLVAAGRRATVAARSVPPYGGPSPMNLPFSPGAPGDWKSFAEFNRATLGTNRRAP